MNYFKIEKDNLVNGDGFRSVLWTAGCSNGCPGCHNPETWSPNNGQLFTEDSLNELIESLKPDYVSGLTLTGGDPFYPGNRSCIKEVVKKVREVFGDTKTIWAWSGYLFENLLKEEDAKEIIENLDVLVDGPFILEKKKVGLKLRGSENQRVIDVQESLKENKTIERRI